LKYITLHGPTNVIFEHAMLYIHAMKGVRGRRRFGKAGLDAKGT
jgi:hypothetical protein